MPRLKNNNSVPSGKGERREYPKNIEVVLSVLPKKTRDGAVYDKLYLVGVPKYDKGTGYRDVPLFASSYLFMANEDPDDRTSDRWRFAQLVSHPEAEPGQIIATGTATFNGREVRVSLKLGESYNGERTMDLTLYVPGEEKDNVEFIFSGKFFGVRAKERMALVYSGNGDYYEQDSVKPTTRSTSKANQTPGADEIPF